MSEIVNCPFCNILKNKEREILDSRAHTFVILSNPRLMPGHLLIIPKRHVEKPSELTTEERFELFDTLIKYQEKILKNVSSGCDISQHCRPFLPQSRLKVDHVHFHLRPREFEDELYVKSHIHDKEIFKDLSEEEAEKFKQIYKM